MHQSMDAPQGGATTNKGGLSSFRRFCSAGLAPVLLRRSDGLGCHPPEILQAGALNGPRFAKIPSGTRPVARRIGPGEPAFGAMAREFP